MKIVVNIDDREVRALLGRLQEKVSDPAPAMREVGEILHRSIRKNFKAGGRPEWKASGRVKREGGVTLTDTGRLKNSFTVEAGRDRVSVGTNVKYAAIHHFGGKTRPHTIKPKTKKALFWPGAGHPVKSVRHPGSKMPPRPFLVVQDEDWPKIKRALTKHIMEADRS